jgi:hypothetical protein
MRDRRDGEQRRRLSFMLEWHFEQRVTGDFGMLAIDMSKPFKSGSVLLVTDVLHPIDNFPHQCLLNGNMPHSPGGACAVPMLLTR